MPTEPTGQRIRPAIKAAIKRASKNARQSMNRLDAAMLNELEHLYRGAVADLQAAVDAYAGRDSTLKLEVLNDLLTQANARLGQLEQARNHLLNDGLAQAAAIGTRPFVDVQTQLSASLTRIADEAVRLTVNFIGADGLQLSDRLWRLDHNARSVVAESIQSAIIQGHSASQSAADFLSRGIPLPDDVRQKLTAASSKGIQQTVAARLMKNEGNPYADARRVFRTEINRAHGEAYQAAVFAHPDTVGTRFLLSPGHPKRDICDLHAHANLYGLGPGVYPQGKNPWPAHPNTLSYVEVVFSDEVTESDKAGQETRLQWLAKQSASAQNDVLGADKKGQAFRAGVLREGEIGTPWRVLQKKYLKKGLAA